MSGGTVRIRDGLLWGSSASTIREVFKKIVRFLSFRWRHLVDELQGEAILAKIDGFCRAIRRKKAPMARCWGFLDATSREAPRRRGRQMLVYKGRRRVHALKYQTVETPDGMLRHLWGPMVGQIHDATLLERSELEVTLSEDFNDDNDRPWFLFGNSDYDVSPWVLAPFVGNVTRPQRLLNDAFRRARWSDEGGFDKIAAAWPFIDSLRQKRRHQVPAGRKHLEMKFIVAGLLTNFQSCFYGNSTSNRFELSPPCVEDFMNGEG